MLFDILVIRTLNIRAQLGPIHLPVHIPSGSSPKLFRNGYYVNDWAMMKLLHHKILQLKAFGSPVIACVN